ncbi:B2 protein-like [Salvia miltiorrhiza]|uniref:B2 protein-like n=1 Tax=Salvia miltiorrhiza TaxID=226208 RepID=UPI0025AB9CB4|nr:B2 protein-like [Salvia miltiorrhiza]
MARNPEYSPQGEALGGYIFVCNNVTMPDCFRRRIFGLPARNRESVSEIRPGMPIFLYNFNTGLLYGIFEAVSFGGMNIDPLAWPDPNFPGRSAYPAQVRVRCRVIRPPLNDSIFRLIVGVPIRYRRRLSVTQALNLLDIYEYLHCYCVALAREVIAAAIALPDI